MFVCTSQYERGYRVLGTESSNAMSMLGIALFTAINSFMEALVTMVFEQKFVNVKKNV